MTGGDLAARARLDAAFAREERRGLIVAVAARSAAVVIILRIQPPQPLQCEQPSGTAGRVLSLARPRISVRRSRLAQPRGPVPPGGASTMTT